ncbi:unnamed protein product, partial [Ectocarpus sp. 12 AP-2014]
AEDNGSARVASAWRHLPAQKTSGVDANFLPLHEDLFHIQAGALGHGPVRGIGFREDLMQTLRWTSSTIENETARGRSHFEGQGSEVSTVYGFCGGVGCRTTIHDPPGKARPLVQSTCPSTPRSDARQEAVALNLGSARMGSDTSPCTNMVLKCFFCSQDNYIWKYG